MCEAGSVTVGERAAREDDGWHFCVKHVTNEHETADSDAWECCLEPGCDGINKSATLDVKTGQLQWPIPVANQDLPREVRWLDNEYHTCNWFDWFASAEELEQPSAEPSVRSPVVKRDGWDAKTDGGYAHTRDLRRDEARHLGR